VIELWLLRLADTAPTLPVPLRAPDADIPLDLSRVLSAVYDEAAYDLSIDYTQAPPAPTLPKDEAQWLAQGLAPYRSP
jgi:hypothetical protein